MVCIGYMPKMTHTSFYARVSVTCTMELVKSHWFHACWRPNRRKWLLHSLCIVLNYMYCCALGLCFPAIYHLIAAVRHTIGEATYSLIGVANHLGGYGGGHYTAYVAWTNVFDAVSTSYQRYTLPQTFLCLLTHGCTFLSRIVMVWMPTISSGTSSTMLGWAKPLQVTLVGILVTCYSIRRTPRRSLPDQIAEVACGMWPNRHTHDTSEYGVRGC